MPKQREVGGEVDVVAAAAAGEVRFSFQSVVKCPRCGATDTIATSTQGEIQHRKCRRGVCLHRFKAVGTRVQ